MKIDDLNIIAGSIPAKVRGLVAEWAELHQDELQNMWNTKKFFFDSWLTLAWECGFDISPESLYFRVTGKKYAQS